MNCVRILCDTFFDRSAVVVRRCAELGASAARWPTNHVTSIYSDCFALILRDVRCSKVATACYDDGKSRFLYVHIYIYTYSDEDVCGGGYDNDVNTEKYYLRL